MSAIMNNKTNFHIVLIMIVVVGGTLWQSQYVYSPLEWGLILSNAKDLTNGYIPYQEIFIQYGYLTALIHAIAFTFLGGNLLSLMAITSAMYASGLVLIYHLSLTLKLTKHEALLLLLLYIFFHPILIYPWSNYLAFPFLLLGLKYNIDPKGGLLAKFYSGLFLSLAVLTREGLAPAVILFMIGTCFFQYLSSREALKNIKEILISFVGLLVPIAIFLYYLVDQNLLMYWKNIAWDVPKLYAEVMFTHMRGFTIYRPWSILPLLQPLWDQIKHSFIQFEPRWILFGLIVVVNALVFLKGLINRRYLDQHLMEVKISLFSLVLLSSTLHLPELFRVITGSAIGVLNVWVSVKNCRHRTWLYCILMISFALTLFPSGTGYKFSTTNYFFPSAAQRSAARPISQPLEFGGQKWSQEIVDFYFEIKQDLGLVKTKCPTIRYLANDTHDAFLQVISPLIRYQLAPFWLFPEMVALRSELDLSKKMSLARDLVLLQSTRIAGKELPLLVPEQFYLFRSYDVPNTSEQHTQVRLLIPKICDLKNQQE